MVTRHPMSGGTQEHPEEGRRSWPQRIGSMRLGHSWGTHDVDIDSVPADGESNLLEGGAQ